MKQDSPFPAKLKIPPHSQESEMMVLGCMLTNVNSLNIAADSLEDTDFYFAEHRLIFHVLRHCYRQDRPADVHIVSEELKRQGKLEEVGGVVYVMQVAQYAGTSAYIEEYIQLIKNKSLLRKMIQAAQKIEQESFQDPSDVISALDEAQKLLFQIGQSANPIAGKALKDLLSGAESDSKMPFLKLLEDRQELYRTRGPEDPGITGIPTYLNDLDKMVNGLGNSNLLILAARPAMGKTALALNIAENVCFKGNLPIGIFSLEMSADQLVHRLISSQSQVDSEKLQNGSLNSMEYQKVVRAVYDMQKSTMIIDDQPGLRITDLRARARRMKETHNIGALIIDYLQLLTGSGNNRSGENRQNEISEISRMLKTLARELNIPIICLAQLSRKVEERTGHRPMLSDLRESGSIEQDADVVLFLTRRDYYDQNDKPGMAELIIAKNRHGATGSVFLTFRKNIGQFANYTPVVIDPKALDNLETSPFDAFSP